MIIKIKNLKLKTILGVYDFEKTNEREIIINATITTKHLKSTISDNLSDTIDYDEIVQKIKKFLLKNNFNLIEKLAKEILNLIMEDQRVSKCELEIDKTNAVENVDSFSITLIEER